MAVRFFVLLRSLSHISYSRSASSNRVWGLDINYCSSDKSGVPYGISPSYVFPPKSSVRIQFRPFSAMCNARPC